LNTLTTVTIGRKVAFPPHVTLYDGTKAQFGCGDFETAPEVGIIDIIVATSDILT